MIGTVEQDPNAVLDYTIDWTKYLQSGETITTSAWSVPVSSGLIIVSDTVDSSNTKTSVWVRGGVISNRSLPVYYNLSNQITTSLSRTDVRSIRMSIVYL